MQIIFETATGSKYLIDQKSMTWTRLLKTAKSGTIRDEVGKLLSWPIILKGRRAYMEIEPHEGTHPDMRFLSTSPVIAVMEVESEADVKSGGQP